MLFVRLFLLDVACALSKLLDPSDEKKPPIAVMLRITEKVGASRALLLRLLKRRNMHDAPQRVVTYDATSLNTREDYSLRLVRAWRFVKGRLLIEFDSFARHFLSEHADDVVFWLQLVTNRVASRNGVRTDIRSMSHMFRVRPSVAAPTSPTPSAATPGATSPSAASPTASAMAAADDAATMARLRDMSGVLAGAWAVSEIWPSGSSLLPRSPHGHVDGAHAHSHRRTARRGAACGLRLCLVLGQRVRL